MTDLQPDEPTREGHPVLWGVVALVGVAALVGLVLAGGAFAASRVLGLSDDSSSSNESTAQETMVVPEPSETAGSSSPSITLAPGAEPETPTYTRDPEPEFEITLESAQTSVAPMQAIDLSGTYPGGDGAILRVQQFSGGVWTEFPVTASVNGGSYSTYIQASAPGENRFRMIDTDTGEFSNEIKVRIG